LLLAGALAPAARGDAVLQAGSVATEAATPSDPNGINDPFNSRTFTTLPTATATGASVPGAFTVGSYHLDANLFQFDLIHDARGNGGEGPFQATSQGDIFFQVTEATTYTISGSRSVSGSQAADAFAFALVELGEAGGPDLYFEAGGVVPTVDTPVTLGQPLIGSATGVLQPGITYEFQYAFTTTDTQSTTHLQLALTPGEVQPVPLPGAAWGGAALIGALAVARQRRRLA
jgi:hypothetical protein